MHFFDAISIFISPPICICYLLLLCTLLCALAYALCMHTRTRAAIS